MAATPILLYGPDNKPLSKRASLPRYNNTLIGSATQTKDRKQVSLLDYDVHRTVTNLGRRTIMSLGRKLYYDCPSIRGAIKEKAEYATSIYLPQYYGRNEQWGIAAEAWLENHDRICDIAGPPYNMRLYRRNLAIAIDRDGDALTVLIKSPSGFPLLQCIPGHRVGWKDEALTVRVRLYQDSMWIDGVQCGSKMGRWFALTFGREIFEDPAEFEARIIDGVIVNDFNAAIAYRVNTSDDPRQFTTWQDVPARDAFLSFVPEFVGQVRGFSQLGITALPLLDIHESDSLELISQKVGAAISLIEKNAEGEAPPGDADGFPVGGSSGETSHSEEIVTDSGALVRYLRSGDPNTALETLKFDRPSANQQNFRSAKLRDAFAGVDWSIDFSLDPQKVGGAPFRVVVEKLNRNITAVQDLVIYPACLRIDGFRVSSAIQIGLLPKDVDWWKWTYQGPARITADKKYDSDVDKQEIATGTKTRKHAIANRGGYIDDLDIEIERDGTAKWAMAKRISDKFGVAIETAYNSLWSQSPNGLQPSQEPEPDAPEEKPE